MRKFQRLRFFIPTVMLGLFLVTATLGLYFGRQTAFDYTYGETTNHLRDRISFIQGTAEQFVELRMLDRLQHMISSFAADSDLASVHIVDARGQVLASDELGDTGQAWTELPTKFHMQHIQSVRLGGPMSFHYESGQDVLGAYASLCGAAGSDTLRPRECGFINYRVSLENRMQATSLAMKNLFVFFLLGMAMVVLASLGLLQILVARRTVDISSLLKKFSDGDRGGRLVVRRHDEIGDLSESINGLLDKIVEDEKAIHDANKKLEERARTDKLTNLFNREYFDSALAEEIPRATRVGTPLTLILVDVDYFKPFNDHYGHPEGDSCLREIAFALREVFKRTGEVVARYGGEEFAVILPHCDEKSAKNRADALLQTIWDKGIPHESSLVANRVTVSIGTTTWQPGSTEPLAPADMILAADNMLYKAKNTGRNRAHHIQLITGPQKVHREK